MRNSFRIAVAIAALVAIGALIAESLRIREPSYKGKTLDEWLDEYNAARDVAKIGPASEAIRCMGTNCLPYLIAHIKHQDSALKNELFNIIANQRWIKHPFYGANPYCGASVLALSALGSDAAPVLPELSEMAQGPDENNSWLGCVSLLALGPSSIPRLAAACRNTNRSIRILAVKNIAKLTSSPGPWVSWVWPKSFPPSNVRMALDFEVDYPINDQLQLIDLLNNPDAAVRRASAEAILEYSHSRIAKEAVVPLVKALNDPDPAARLAAGHALKEIDPVAAVKEGIK